MTIKTMDAYDFWPRLGRTLVYVAGVTTAIVLPVTLAGMLLLR